MPDFRFVGTTFQEGTDGNLSAFGSDWWQFGNDTTIKGTVANAAPDKFELDDAAIGFLDQDSHPRAPAQGQTVTFSLNYTTVAFGTLHIEHFGTGDRTVFYREFGGSNKSVTGSFVMPATPVSFYISGYAAGGGTTQYTLVLGNGGTPPTDTTKPTLSDSAPDDNQPNVPVGANIELTFSEDVKRGTGTIFLRRASDDAIVEQFDVATSTRITVAGDKVTINPTSDLAPGTSYYVTIPSGAIKDLANNNFDGIVSKTGLDFTTAAASDNVAPTLSNSDPLDGAVDVAVDKNIVLNFNEAVKAGVGNIVIRKSSDDTVVETIPITDTSRVTFAGTSVTINPANNLAAGTGYYLAIATGVIQDNAGNNFAGFPQKTDFDFTTAGGKPVASFAPGSHQLVEGNGTDNPIFSFQVQLDRASTSDVFIRYHVDDLGATFSSDYELVTPQTPGFNAGVLHFAPGVTAQTIQIRILSDEAVEADEEEFQVVLEESQTALLPGGATTLPKAGTIIDDDGTEELPAGPETEGYVEYFDEVFDYANDWLDIAEKTNKSGFLRELRLAGGFEKYLSPDNLHTKALVQRGLQVASDFVAFYQLARSIEKGIDAYAQNRDFGAAVEVASRDAIVWAASNIAGKVALANGVVFAMALAPGIPVIGALAVGVIAHNVVQKAAKSWFQSVWQAPPEAEEELDARSFSLSSPLQSSLTSSADTDFWSVQVGDSAPEPYWELNPETGEVTLLRPLTPEIEARLNETATRLGLNIANPVALTFHGDQYADVDDLIVGGSGANTIFGLSGNDTLVGGVRADTIDGGTGKDVMAGGFGDDTYFVDFTRDSVIEDAGHGADTVYTIVNFALAAGSEVEVLRAQDETGTTAIDLTGNEFANTLRGNAGANKLDGLGGADIMHGLGGNDRFYVNDGNDRAIEAAGQGLDTVFATVNFRLQAGSEIEVLRVQDQAGTGALDLIGNEFDNTLLGNAGANRLDGRGGVDSMSGFAGRDSYYVDHGDDRAIEAVGNGVDTVFTNVTFRLAAGSEIEVLRVQEPDGTAAIDLTGNEFRNTLRGNAGVNRLDGRDAADTMYGLGGRDSYYVNHSGDRAIEAADQGLDTVFTVVDFRLEAGSEIEVLRVQDAASTTAIDLTGNEFRNTLQGNAGANSLDGREGADTMVGLGGRDRYYVDHGNDRAVEAAGLGLDTVFTTVNFRLEAGSEIEILRVRDESGTAAIDLTGNEFRNTLRGNAGANSLDGLGGADTMFGFDGGDSYHVDHGNDRAVEELGEGLDTVFTTVNFRLEAGSEIEVLRARDEASSAAIDLTGNEFRNTLHGNAGANRLDGRGGADTMVGLGGRDSYYVDHGNDRAVEAVGEGIDTVFTDVNFRLEAGSEIEVLRIRDAAGTDAIDLTGNEFDNTLRGNAGNNRLEGQAGADILDGGLGADLLDAGAGDGKRDTFVFAGGYGADTAVNYEAGTDRFDLSAVAGLNVYGDVQVLMSEIAPGGGGTDVLIDFGAGDTLRIKGATIALLNANQGDFLL